MIGDPNTFRRKMIALAQRAARIDREAMYRAMDRRSARSILFDWEAEKVFDRDADGCYGTSYEAPKETPGRTESAQPDNG